ncbi:hypothetical protein GCM10010521_22330 [Streptomyces rameus]|uniref:Uncharacterized protein n=1 Tax=Streptomyces rameus TaxID=68261 RepID=A0ABP6N4N4_9ACTN
MGRGAVPAVPKIPTRCVVRCVQALGRALRLDVSGKTASLIVPSTFRPAPSTARNPLCFGLLGVAVAGHRPGGDASEGLAALPSLSEEGAAHTVPSASSTRMRPLHPDGPLPLREFRRQAGEITQQDAWIVEAGAWCTSRIEPLWDQHRLDAARCSRPHQGPDVPGWPAARCPGGRQWLHAEIPVAV